MVKIDLITGFLGSGKTTFIKKYAKYWMNQGCTVGILENDFGAVNVDMMLLQDIMGDNCEIEMIAGGCDLDCHRRRFKTKLISMGMCGYDRVLVEPSGIYDVDEFFDVLREEPLDRWYEIGNVIAIVDAKLEEELSEESEYLLASQAANAGRILLSRTQEATEEEIERTIAHLNRGMEKFQCGRRFRDEVCTKDWDALTEEDFSRIADSGYELESHVKEWFDQKKTFSSLYFMNIRMNAADLKAAAEKLMQDTACGRIFRIKGFMQVENGKWVELNATHNEISIRPIENGQEILIVIGEALVEDKIKTYLEIQENI